ncbi:MAG: flippase [Candidatus Schekmanbacteria bacterium]|nr:flippase [Candidatus Schekmanbacteria bacterium]
MFSKIKKLFSDSIFYVLGNTAGKIVGFLLIPLYTRYLTPADYGILSLCSLFGSFLFIFLNLGMSSAIFKNYFKAETPEGKNLVLSTSGFIMLLISLPVMGIIIVNSAGISRLLLGSPVYANAVIIVSLTGVFSQLAKIPFSCLRAQGESKKYAVLTLSDTGFTLLLTIFLVVAFKKGFWGILISQCLAGLLVCLILIPWILRDVPFRFSLTEAKSLLRFGVPLIFSGIGGIILTLSDRYMLKMYSTLDQVGIYSLGYRFGEILWFLAWAFQLAWPQFVFSNEKSPNANELYSKTSTYFFAIMSFVCLSLSILAREIIILATTPKFLEAYRVIPIIALSQLFYGLFNVVAVGVYLKSKTSYFSTAVGIAALLNVGLNFLWIPSFGMMGAAYATLLAYIFQFIMIVVLSMKLYPVRYEFGRIIKLIAISLALYLAGVLINIEAISVAIAYKCMLILLFPVLLWLSGFFAAQEKARLYRLWEFCRIS